MARSIGGKRTSESLGPEQESAPKRAKMEKMSTQMVVDVTEDMDDEDDEYRDLSTDEEDNTDLEDEEKNAAAYLKQKMLNKGNLGMAPNAGFIKKMVVKSFMNHSNTVCDMAPKMNFLVGHNGSGKSAILTAISIVLGAKASATGRGHSVKDLIQRGKDRATLIMTMANEQPGAFEHEKYGDNIIIERTIDKSGASNYKFRASPDGKVLANKREVITQICSHFNIDIDSPLTILTQDAAKSFLAQSDPEKLYKFFLRGTKLSNLFESYEKTTSDTYKIEVSLAQAEESIPELKSKVSRLHRQVQAARQMSDLRLDFANAKLELAWAFVGQAEVQAKTERTQLEGCQSKLEATKEAQQESLNRHGPLLEQKEALNQEIMDHNAQNKPIQAKKAAAKKELDRQRLDLSVDDAALEEVNSEIATAQQEVANLEKQLDERAQSTGAMQNPREGELRTQIDKLGTLIANMRRSVPGLERDLKSHEDELDTKAQTIAQAEAHRDSIQRDLSRAREVRNQILRSQKNRLEAFGENIQKVMDEIKKARWRGGTPIGPIGQYVQLNDMSYRTAIESWMGSTMCSFIVLHPQDTSMLQQILQRCQRSGYRPPGGGRLPSVICFLGDLFDFSNGDCTGRQMGEATAVETVLGKLTITNEIVLRVLVNHQKVEKVLVAKDVRAADSLIDKVLADPQHSGVNILSGGDQPFLSTGRSRGNKSSGPVQQWRAGPLFFQDLAGEADKVHHQIQELEAAHQTAVSNVGDLINGRKVLDRKVADTKRNLQKVNGGIPKAEAQQRALQDELESILPPEGDALLIYKLEREEVLKGLKIQLAELEGSRQVKLDAVTESEAKLKEIEDQDLDFLPIREKKMAAYMKVVEKIATTQKAVKHWEDRVKREEYEIEQQTKKVEKAESSHQLFFDRAKNMGITLLSDDEPRVVEKSMDELTNRKVALEKQLAEAEKRSAIDVDKAAAEYNAAKAQLLKQQNAVHTFARVIKMLKANMKKRKTNWEILRSHMAVRARTGFIQHLNTRHMAGSLVFNHEDDTLTISVESTGLGDTQAADTQAPTRLKAPQALSGGERSYVTVCFLLSLWDLMPSTIRCLDEWDVFLDMVNRQLAARMLIEGAKQSSGKQYVLITPQDMAGFDKNAPSNKVIRLGDPVRAGQTTLPFQAV